MMIYYNDITLTYTIRTKSEKLLFFSRSLSTAYKIIYVHNFVCGNFVGSQHTNKDEFYKMHIRMVNGIIFIRDKRN